MAAAVYPALFEENPTRNAFLTLFAAPSYHGAETVVQSPHDSAEKPRPGRVYGFQADPRTDVLPDEVARGSRRICPRTGAIGCAFGSDVPRPEVYDFLRKWQRQMYEAGFVGVTWPKEYGGAASPS